MIYALLMRGYWYLALTTGTDGRDSAAFKTLLPTLPFTGRLNGRRFTRVLGRVLGGRPCRTVDLTLSRYGRNACSFYCADVNVVAFVYERGLFVAELLTFRQLVLDFLP